VLATLAVGEMVDQDITPNDLPRGLATDGLSTLLAGFMFAMVTAVGIQTLHKVTFGGPHNHNLLIVAVSLSFGLIPTIQPAF
jgi:xanthine/uracil permease